MGRNGLQDCVVTFVDLIGTGDEYAVETGQSSQKMMDFHDTAARTAPDLTVHDHVYAWNDSAVLLAFVDSSQKDWTPIMEDVARFIDEVETIERCYAISVKGQSFPAPLRQKALGNGANFTFLSLSSYAFSNCFRIEKELKRYRRRWYVDGWVKQRLPGSLRGKVRSVRMLPKYSERNVYMYRKTPWNE